MAEFKLGRIRFIWKNEWTTGTTYLKDDVVRNGGKTYVCVAGHTASPDFYTDLNHGPSYWNQVSDGSEWKDDWTTDTFYKLNDIVKYGGRLYICNDSHTSNALASDGTSPETTAGLEADQAKWDLYASSFDWKGAWATSTFYKIDDVVSYGGISYVCNTSHTSSSTNNTDSDGLEQDLSKWDVYNTGFSWKGDWSTNTRYKKNDVVLYGGVSYVCNTGHQSATTATLGLEADQGLWDYLHKGITYLGDWSGSSVRYRVNDVVKYGADLWICTSAHTSATLFSDSTNWAIWVAGLQFYNSWNDVDPFQPGDLATYGGYIYVANTNNTNKVPTSNPDDWTIFTTGFSFQNDWADGTDYRVGHVIRLNGFTYVCLADHSASNSNVPPNNTYWSRLNSGVKWAATTGTYLGQSGTNVIGGGTSATFDVTRIGTYYTVTVNQGGTGYATNDVIKILGTSLGGTSPANDLLLTVTNQSGGVIQASGVTPTGFSVTWTTSTAYYLGDAVTMGVNTYICVQQHTSGSGNRPDVDVTGTYWNLMAAGSITSVLTTQGDTIYYGGNGPTRLPIGTDGQVLRVSGTTPSWAYFGVVNNVVYVAPSGTDASGSGQGLTLDKPFKTIRYAAKAVEEGYLNTNAALLLAENKQFILKEVNNYIQYKYKVTTTGTSSNAFTTTNTSGIYANMPITFTGTAGGVTAGQVYYVKAIVANTSFTISASQTSGVAGAQFNVSGSGANAGNYYYTSSKAERDSGYIVDALVYDISHGGNGNTTTAALAYLNSSGSGYASTVSTFDITAFIGALTYLSNLVTHVVANTVPAYNYQTLNGVLLANQAIQNIDTSLTAESGTSTTLQSLVNIVITGLTGGSTSYVPAAVYANTTISAKTGTFSEVLPIVVPKYTAVVGDELRGTVVQPATANTNLANDTPKSIAVLNRIKALIPNLLTNQAVTPTSGNTTPQAYINGFAGSSTAISRTSTNTTTINTILAGGLGSVPSFTLTTPTGGTGNAYTAGYANAARLIYANKAFIQAEIAAWMAYAPNGYSSLWSSLGSGGQSNCTRDIGYEVDALRYDLTYGGNLETVVAARSYYSNGNFVEASNEKAAALAVQTYLASIISDIAQGISITKTSGNAASQDTSGTGGSSTAGTFAVNRVNEIKASINSGAEPTTIYPDITWASSDLQSAFAMVQSRRSLIQTGVIAALAENYPTLSYNQTTCSRDVGYIVDALCYDFVFNSNFRSCKAAMAYYRATSSAQVVVNNQLTQTEYTISYINSAIQDIAAGVVGDSGSTAAVNSVLTNTSIITSLLNNGLSSAPTFTFTTPTGYNTSFLAGYGDGKAQIVQNYQFIKDEISAWLAYAPNGYSTVWSGLGGAGQAACQRDVGYILDALQYDMTYGGNTQSLIAGSAYYSFSTLMIASGEKSASIAAYNRLQTIVGQIVQKQAVTVTSGNTTSQVTTGTAGSAGAATFAQARVGDVITWITNGTAPATIAPTAAIALASTELQNGYNALQAYKAEIQSDTVGWVQKFYQSLNFDSTTCSRDAGLIVDALSYDLVFGTNFNSVKAGMSYFRTQAQVVINSQLAAEIGAVNFIGQKAKRIAAYGSVAQALTTIDDIIGTITGTITTTATATAVNGNITVGSTTGMYAGMPVSFASGLGGIVANRTYWILSVVDSTTFKITDTNGGVASTTLSVASGSSVVTANTGYEVTGSTTYNNVLSTINGAEILRANKSFLMSEASAYVTQSYGGTVTSSTASTGRFATSSAHNLTAGDPVVFSGTTFGGILANTTYYVVATPTSTTFTVTATQGSSTVVTLSDATGSMTVRYSFSVSSCQRDTAAYVDALVYDICYLGNYKSMRAAVLYKNAVTGSLLSDMFYVRNGTGLRNMTFSGLTGALGTANSYGTKRPTAGSYVSLDPGFGPNDSGSWILQRSPYVQNVTTFGTACVGCKIDGALHQGGNRSIVANDFTQVLSDGIGVWCTGHNSLTELVSVFTYYNYAGYLAEYGGKIRATNGNNSYGTYGSLAEGVDTYEVPITATVNNRYNQATITNVVTDSTNQVYRLEFFNAGSKYNSATYSISGTGYNVATVGNEFRDNAVFQTRVLTGGANYVTQSNTAQAGNATSITIAATDAAISAAYVGMRIQLTGGTGNGQTGFFLTYNSGTKLGLIAKESFTPLTVTATTNGTPSTLTVASTASLYATMPFVLASSVGGLTSYTVYYVQSVVNSTTFTVSGTSGGAAYTTQITTTTGQSVTMYAAGWDHVVPGWPIVSALDLTTAYIIEPRITYTAPSFTVTSRTQQNSTWVDCAYGDTNATYSAVAATGGSGSSSSFTVVRTGVAYAVTIAAGGSGYVAGNTLTIPGTSVGGTSPANDITITVTNVSSGSINNITYTGTGSGGQFIAIAGSGTTTQYSTNGTSWSAGGALSTSASWSAVASGGGYWVAVATGTNATSYTTSGSSAWSAGGNLPSSGSWSAICYGNSQFMAIQSGSTAAAVSTNGSSWAATSALPSSTTWSGVAYGNGIYVAIASGGTTAASYDGTSWTARTLPASATWNSVTFGNGRFVATASGSTNVAYSLNGTTWYSAPAGIGTSQTWSKVRYGQGLFMAVSTGSTSTAATSPDGINWTSRTLSTTGSWTGVAFGNPSSTPIWVTLTTGTTTANSIVGGATARGRIKVSAGAISEIRMVEPGSGYSADPTVTVVDPNQTVAGTWQVRTGVGALANPTFTNRGAQYSTATATVTGNGYGDEYQTGYYFNVAGLPSQPTAGANVVLTGDSNYYKLVAVSNYLGTGGGLAPYTARFQISPAFSVANAPAHGTAVTMRIKYSQVRLTGHDFLSIGTGGVTTTNYPGTPTQTADAAKQTVNNGGGRVFYTATDQDGNFTVGTLFSVQQATGVASINADAFNLAGLNSLTLGSVSLGATSATITQFSTDPYFTANSDNIVPTQKAIKAYVASQIGGGSSALNVNTLTAGVIYIAGNSISTTSGVQILVPATMNFTGGINGVPLAMNLLLLG